MNILPPVYVYIYIDQTLRKISRLTNIASQCPGLTKCHLCIVQSTLPDVASFFSDNAVLGPLPVRFSKRASQLVATVGQEINRKTKQTW